MCASIAASESHSTKEANSMKTSATISIPDIDAPMTNSAKMSIPDIEAPSVEEFDKPQTNYPDK